MWGSGAWRKVKGERYTEAWDCVRRVNARPWAWAQSREQHTREHLLSLGKENFGVSMGACWRSQRWVVGAESGVIADWIKLNWVGGEKHCNQYVAVDAGEAGARSLWYFGGRNGRTWCLQYRKRQNSCDVSDALNLGDWVDSDTYCKALLIFESWFVLSAALSDLNTFFVFIYSF